MNANSGIIDKSERKKKKKTEAVQMPTNQANNGKIKSCLSMQWDTIQQWKRITQWYMLYHWWNLKTYSKQKKWPRHPPWPNFSQAPLSLSFIKPHLSALSLDLHNPVLDGFWARILILNIWSTSISDQSPHSPPSLMWYLVTVVYIQTLLLVQFSKTLPYLRWLHLVIFYPLVLPSTTATCSLAVNPHCPGCIQNSA